MEDFRVNIGFVDHKKTRKLKRSIGDGAAEVVLRLWSHCTLNKSCRMGVLKDFDADDIADVCRWQGDPSELVEALLDAQWLKARPTGNGFTLPDWENEQPWVSGWKERQQRSKKAARSRWGNKEDADSMPDACGEHTEGMRKVSGSHAPRISDAPGQSEKAEGKQQTAMRDACGEHAESNAPYLTLPNHTIPTSRSIDLVKKVYHAEEMMKWGYSVGLGQIAPLNSPALTGLLPLGQDELEAAWESTRSAAKPNWKYLISVLETRRRKPETKKRNPAQGHHPGSDWSEAPEGARVV